MSIKIGINGFGRIGRYLIRLLADQSDVEIAVINARADNPALAHLLKYDSVHGQFPVPITPTKNGLSLNGREIPVTRQPTDKWTWGDYTLDIAVETTGSIKDRPGLAKHLACGAKKVVVSSPITDADILVVMGVNDNKYDPAKHDVISAASCTTNCLTPPAMVIHENFGIKHGLMTTIHSYTMSQRILDGSNKDWRRARAAAVNMIPTSTGAAKAAALVYPALAGKLDGMAIRVPTPNVSLVDLTCELETDVDVARVNAVLKAAANGPLKGNMGFSEEPLVSVDYTGSSYGGVVDSLLTTVLDKRLLKLIIWYDNESGFTNQLARLIRLVGK